MSTKNDPGKYNCYTMAFSDEPIFVLLARDPQAPSLIRQWAEQRLRDGEDREKILEALKCARLMEQWRECNYINALPIKQFIAPPKKAHSIGPVKVMRKTSFVMG